MSAPPPKPPDAPEEEKFLAEAWSYILSWEGSLGDGNGEEPAGHGGGEEELRVPA